MDRIAFTCLRRLYMAVVCPECDNPLTLNTDDVEEGDTLECDECGAQIEIVSADPLELATVDSEGYDDEGEDARSVDEDEDES
jgi:alpha-aminoadipate carrier protein LysW